jgi:predicted  nucleic acid-binding Zn-ribbon protein
MVENAVSSVMLDYLRSQRDAKVIQKEVKSNSKINDLKITLHAAEEKINNLLNAIAEGNEIFAKHANEKIKELDKECNRLNREIAKETANKNEDVKLRNIDRDFIICNWDKLEFDHKREIAGIVIKQVTISNDGIDVEFY